MPTIVSPTDFQNEPLFIPNSIEVPDIQDNSVNAVDNLQLFIDQYERLLLVNVLGITQYNVLKENQSQSSGIWKSLIDGKEYDGKLWLGLKPLIKAYVFYNYLFNDKSYYTTVGIERSASKNSLSINPTENLVEVWNNFVEMYQGLYCDFNFWQPIFYFEGWDYGRYENKSFVTLSEYLKDLPGDYSTEYFKRYEVKNRLGL